MSTPAQADRELRLGPPERLAELRHSWAERRLGPLELVIALTVIGGIVRFATLNVSSIELDESATLILVHRGFSGMLSHLARSESTPPLYYMLVWAWTKVFGAGVVGFRSLSALIGTLTIPVMYLAGREISARAGLWAAALATFSPSMFFFSQEARTYGLLILFSACAFVAWQRALHDPSGRRLAWWALWSGLALLAHYFAAFLFVSEALVLLTRVGWRRVWAAIGAVALVGLALVPLAISQRSDGKTSWIEELALPRRVAESIKMFTVGVYGPLVLFAMVIAMAITLGAIVLVARHGDRRERAGAWDAAIAATGAIAIPLALAVTHVIDVYDGRNMLAFWVPFAVLLSIGLGTAGARRAGTLLGATLCAIYLAMVVSAILIPEYRRDNWRGVAHSLGTPSTARLIVTEGHASNPLSIYMRGLSVAYGTLPPVGEVDFVALRHLRTVGPPQPGFVPTDPPPGFRLAAFTRTETFTISRFRASGTSSPSAATLVRASGSSGAEIALQR
ncbi:MAG TPA: glycosyltransferase family 39 protein [Solirubrobacteraceae bacterium]|jgi:mannosyltransferase|nr:glycosyltransferase family 39 protein [Solirubrobacteraceae bacterium]